MANVEIMPSGFLSLEQTSKVLGRAPKSIERFVASGVLASKQFPRKGRKPERMYEEASVQALKERMAKRISPRPEARAPRAIAGPAKTELALSEGFQTIARELIGRLSEPRPTPASEKLWLSLNEAAEYSGLSRGTLLDLCHEGRLTACKSAGWKIRRASLEAFAG